MKNILLQSTLMRFSLGATLLLAAAAGCNNAATTTATSSDTTPNASNSTAAAQPTATPRAFVRAVHVVPGGPAAALMIDGQKVVDGVTYGNASTFVGVEPGDLNIKAIASSGQSLAGPMPVELEKGEDLTVVINGVPGDVALLPFDHENGGPQAGQAKLAFLHAAKALPEVEILIDGERYRDDVDYGDATDYEVITAGKHELTITYTKTLPATPVPTPIAPPGSTIITQSTPTPPKARLTLTQPVDLVAGKVYSLIVFHDEKRQPKLRLLEDRFANTLQNAPSNDANATATP
jgi:hypothetical protein